MLNLNSQGFLYPDNNIKSSLEEMESTFVQLPGEPGRLGLFDKYKNYSDQLKALVQAPTLLQWIDGSYVTEKRKPNDIDLATFINAEQ